MKVTTQTLARKLSSNWGWAAGVIATLLYVKPFGGREFSINGDGLYLIWAGLIQSENLFGTTKHLGWPEGFSNWQHPQLGLGYSLISSLAALITGSQSATTIFGVSTVLIAAVNGAAANFLLNFIDSRQNYVRNCLTFSLTFAPFLITNIYHLNVAAFYAPILSLYLYLKLSEPDQQHSFHWREYVSLLIILTGVPWWQGSLALIFFMVAIGSLISHSWISLRVSLLVFLSNLIGFLIQTLPSIIFFKSNSLLTRDGWDSNYFGGHFADFLIASPLLNTLVPGWNDRLEPGVSNELNYSGFLGLVGFIVLISSILAGKITKIVHLGLVVILFFTLGAFGNLQAAFAEMLGLKTPLRTWSRLVILIAVLGILILFQNLHKKKTIGILMGSLIAVITILEVTSIHPKWDYDLSEEKQVISELKRETRGDCVVLQIPLNTWPNPYIGSDGKTDETFYSSGIFYTLDNSFYWTYGNWTLGSPEENFNLNVINNALNSEDTNKYLKRHYCAVLIDLKLLESRNLESGQDVRLARSLVNGTVSQNEGRYKLINLG